MSRRRSFGVALVGLLSLILTASFLAYQSPALHYKEWRIQNSKPVPPTIIQDDLIDDHQDLTAGNSTLGFEAIIALSQGTRWRVDGLNAAAAASNIRLLVPAQPKWSDEFIKSFEEFGPVPAHGAAMAWLGHIDLLKLVIQNRWGSALIMEDDVDWDVRIRQQTPMIAKGVRELTKGRNWGLWNHQKENQDNSSSPYGNNWDVLWMGHCSDPPDTLKPIVSWRDDTVISLKHYTGIDLYATTVLKDGERSVHRSYNPVCTFAYAVSAAGARKVLKYASMGQGGAFDLMLKGRCWSGELDCVSVNPEIFDAYHPAGGDISEVKAGDSGAGKPGSFDSAVSQGMGHSDNILQSARCQGLWGMTCLTEYQATER